MKTNPATTIAETLLPRLAKAVAVNPEDVDVGVKHARASTVVSVAATTEAGNLIGKKGRTAKSFKLLARLIGDKHRWQVSYDIQTPMGENPPPTTRPVLSAQEKWSLKDTRDLLRETLMSFLECEPVITATEFQYQTTFEVVLDDSEPQREAQISAVLQQHKMSSEKLEDETHLLKNTEAVNYALSTIFGAIGRIHGRTVYVVLVDTRTGRKAEKQPPIADGRYAKELE